MEASPGIAQLWSENAALEKELEELRRKNEELSSFVEHASLGMHWVGSDGTILWANRADFEMLGYNGEEYIGHHISEFHADGENIQQILACLLRGETLRNRFARLKHKDGSLRHVLIDSSVFWKNGRFSHTQCFTRDITAQREAELSGAHLAAIVASSDDAIISKNLSGIITSWNESAERIYGYKAEEILGKSITVLIPETHYKEEGEIISKIQRGERIDHYETVRRKKDGTLFNVSLTVSPIKDAHGKIVGASKIARDITQQKIIATELLKARDDALAATRAKDEFLAALSHELRTPLNPVLLIASERAADTKLPAEVRSDFEMISKNVALEANLIDDLLDITRISQGKLILNKKRLDVRDQLRSAVKTVHSDFQAKQILIQIHLPESAHNVDADPTRLMQVFWNVLKNAAKFTPNGGRVISTVFRSDDLSRVIVKFKDSGIGLSQEELTRIFQAFAQGDHARPTSHQRFGGLGLGLAISRTLVEMHGGKIYATSDGRDAGSTFTVELPAAD